MPRQVLFAQRMCNAKRVEGLLMKGRGILWVVIVTACVAAIAWAAPRSVMAQKNTAGIGIFEGSGDIGTVLHKGSAEYDASKQSYTLSGSGENIWFAADAFQYAWKKVSGDVELTADLEIVGKEGHQHRKAVLMIRQSLDADSAYVDVARHADGLTSLQVRYEKGAETQQIQSNISAPKRLRITKRGDYYYMSLASGDGEPQVASGSVRLPLRGEFYVGIGMCSHDKDAIATAVFSNVDLVTGSARTPAQPTLYSSLETIEVGSPAVERRVVYVAREHFEAPNWTRDGAALLFNREGRIVRIPAGGGEVETIDTGFAIRCNNDHGISPDGTQLAISGQSQEEHHSIVYIVPIGGGAPRRITQLSPSYWHGWSPDGKTLAFVGQRNDDFDVYTIPAAGGEETRLTTAKGLDDGPDYSPDGQYIYFNSERTGTMQIWRMRADGSEQEQLTSDEYNNWFPHPSPDGKWIVFLSYEKSVTGHPGNKDVMLRLMSLADRKITVLTKLFGGQGTMNVPSWSPDGLRLAFVSYVLVQ